jgi:hypothetical protein
MNALYFAYLHARDSGRNAHAERYLDALIAWQEAHPESHWSTPYVLKAVALAEHGDLTAAREWQSRAGRRISDADRHLMEGAIRAARGDVEGASEEIDLVLADVRRDIQRLGAWGSLRSMERRLLRMREQMDCAT